MSYELQIRRAAVIGAGTMGAQVAAMLANAGVPCALLDVPAKDGRDRNGIVEAQWQRALKLSPAPLYLAESENLVTLGNVEDDLAELEDADWILEAVVERADLKKEVLGRVAQRARDGALITTNTSGIPIGELAQGLPQERRKLFFGTHFFNPPRVMRLLEMIRGPETDLEPFDAFAQLAELFFGKGVVVAKDSPGFISNRIGYFAIQHAVWLAVEEGLTVEEADAITGAPLGRPRSATFRLCDLIGLDVVAQIGGDLLKRLPPDEQNRYFEQPAPAKALLERGWLGEKKGQGYYKRVKTASGSEIQALDFERLDYRPSRKPDLELPRGGVRELCGGGGKAARFAWKHLSAVLRYSADKLFDVAEDAASVDRVLRWGFNWERGPFELWDELGVRETAARIEKEGGRVPEPVEALLKAGRASFYERRGAERFFADIRNNRLEPDKTSPFEIRLDLLRADRRVVFGNAGGSLVDLGDGVACLEFHGKMNALGPEQLDVFEKARAEIKDKFSGLVIANQGPHFSAGVNLKLFVDHIERKDWEGIDRLLQRFQRATCGWAGFDKPVVVACHGYALGAGCETVLAAEQTLAAAETYLGLPEVRVGLIPGAGGCKEMLVRALEWTVAAKSVDAFPFIRRVWEIIFSGRISACAHEALKLGYLRGPPATFILPDAATLVGHAKEHVLESISQGWHPGEPRGAFPCLGTAGMEKFAGILEGLAAGGKITAHDAAVGRESAWVLCGGDRKAGTRITEQDVLDLEREAFLRLCGQPPTLERIRHMLETGKPLKN